MFSVSVLGSGLSILILYQYVFAFVCVQVSCVALVCQRVFSCVATRMCFALMPGLYLCTLVCTDCCIKRVRFRTYLLYDSVMSFASYYDMNSYPTCTTSYKPRIPVIRLWPLPSSLTPPECLRQRLLSYLITRAAPNHTTNYMTSLVALLAQRNISTMKTVARSQLQMPVCI